MLIMKIKFLNIFLILKFKFKVIDLLYALMLRSGNDAAYCLK